MTDWTEYCHLRPVRFVDPLNAKRYGWMIAIARGAIQKKEHLPNWNRRSVFLYDLCGACRFQITESHLNKIYLMSDGDLVNEILFNTEIAKSRELMLRIYGEYHVPVQYKFIMEGVKTMPKTTQKNWTRTMALSRLNDIDAALHDVSELVGNGGKMPAPLRSKLSIAIKRVEIAKKAFADWTP